ncbi:MULTISPECIES: hypothetical protein [Calothrix]|uniref:AAA+ ATPase domain-containing protein n=2 Tax=Calothrix TaxID=1186 RepID=A0ABR8AKN9_9CYAN|nr:MULTISPECIES: hypothetical protein [Calothrix]MBD2200630.1 hypothetical protein [Calothrix parietina FACHB-288]MBD2229683.1 hypothetical protein [Calothrix anomala FACHB-343]
MDFLNYQPDPASHQNQTHQSSQVPSLTTLETARLREDYPSIEHLEAGNVAAWLVERTDQLLVRAKDERAGMNLSKLITLAGGAIGAVCYATSPLAPIGALIASAGYVWAVATDMNASHQFAPIPFIRGNFFEFLSAMGDSQAREEWFSNQNEFVDLMHHLEPLERYEFAMLRQHTHTLTEFINIVEPGKRFYAYRYLLDCFVNFRGVFPTFDQLNQHLAKVSVDPRVNYHHVQAIQQIRPPQLEAPQINLPPPPIAHLPLAAPTTDLPLGIPSSNSSTPIPIDETNTHIDEYSPQIPQTLDVIEKMSQRISNHLIIGIPGAGKGLLVSNALRRIKQLHPQTTIFYIDPKNDPKETGYFSGCVDVLKRASTPSMTPVEIVSWFQNCIREFDALKGDKLLAFDEGTQIGSQFKIAKQLDWLKGKLTSYTSCGDSAGIRVWILAQNPHTEDLGISGGLRSQFTPLAIVSGVNIAAYSAMISTGFIPSSQKISDAKLQEFIDASPVNRAVYHGGLNRWFAMPKLENHSGYDRDSRTFIEGFQPPSPGEFISSDIDTIKILDSSFYADEGETDSLPSETAKHSSETPKGRSINSFSSQQQRFTRFTLLRNEAIAEILRLRNEMNLNQTHIIRILWDARPGENEAYRNAVSEYKQLMADVE